MRVAPGATRGVTWLPAPVARPPRPRVVLIRPDHLGDVLFVGPSIRRLRDAWPDARVTLLVGPWSAPVAARLPGVDAVETVAFPWFDRQPRGPVWRPYARLVRAARRLRGRFDIAIVLRDDDGWSAWLAALAGIPVRAGHADAGVRPFITHGLPAALRPDHAVAAGVALVAALGHAGATPGTPGATVATPAALPATPLSDPLRFRIDAADHAAAVALLGDAVRPIAIHPGAGAAVKRWRSEAWASVISMLAAPGEAVVITGSAGEQALAAVIAAGIESRPVRDVTSRTDVGALGALFARCRLVLGPDSGPLHLAVAVGTPTVHLFGPADARRFGPWGPPARHAVVRADIPCVPCGRLDWPDPSEHPCVRVIDPAQVLAAARSLRALDGAPIM